MKFLTVEWWRGDVDDQDPAFERYQRHLKSIEHALPPELLELERSPLVHDSKLRTLGLDVSAGTLTLALDTWDEGRPVLLSVRYGGVTKLESFADPNVGLSGPHGFGDLGYTEAHLVEGRLQHRLLFSTGIELRVTFSTIAFDSAAR